MSNLDGTDAPSILRLFVASSPGARPGSARSTRTLSSWLRAEPQRASVGRRWADYVTGSCSTGMARLDESTAWFRTRPTNTTSVPLSARAEARFQRPMQSWHLSPRMPRCRRRAHYLSVRGEAIAAAHDNLARVGRKRHCWLTWPTTIECTQRAQSSPFPKLASGSLRKTRPSQTNLHAAAVAVDLASSGRGRR